MKLKFLKSPMNIKLTPFGKSDFEEFISWIVDEELLVTIAGLDFKYPLDDEQLATYLKDPKSLSFNVVVGENDIIGHAEIILVGDGKCKLDKILIGDKDQRGKGIGEELMKVLLDYSFNEMGMNEVELNVYDWNHAGIRCYEKVGFMRNEGRGGSTKFGNKIWNYFNMSIDKNSWKQSNEN